jgi:predicted DNA-binding transcriptional regulator YafY
VDELDDRTCRLQMSADNLDWPALALGAVGADFEVRSPPELVAHIRDWATRFTRATTA